MNTEGCDLENLGCFHCGEQIRSVAKHYLFEVGGQQCVFCCPACHAAAEAICGGGLAQFYQYRKQQDVLHKPSENSFTAYDLKSVQSDFVITIDEQMHLYQAQLLVPNISCAACAWLIENYLSNKTGVHKVNVNVSNHQCSIVWDSSLSKLSVIFAELNHIGYQAVPATTDNLKILRVNASRSMLLRLGVAGIAMMQVGMVSIALHAGDIQGIDLQWRGYLRWVSLLFALPVMIYSAHPFFVSAVRGLKIHSINMDVSISLALLLAFFASIWATIFNTGQVYFDSLSMLVFFLLVGRYLEMRARYRYANKMESLTSLLPLTVNKISGSMHEVVPLKSLVKDDVIEVVAGSVFPCDGIVLEGSSYADESMLTGESQVINKSVGSQVFAGTTNGVVSLIVRVSALGDQTELNAINKMRIKAFEEKPKFQTLVNRLAVWFVVAVILISVVNYLAWTIIAPEDAFWVTLSVLVVTCPCALSLATPAALTAGVQRMQSLGLLITSSQFLERLKNVTHVVFDKTGTLTSGKLKVSEIKMISSKMDDNISSEGSITRQQVLEIIAALEVKSTHPIAHAFNSVNFDKVATNVVVDQGYGISGVVDGVQYRFGSRSYACPVTQQCYPGEGLWQLLAAKDGPIAWVLFEDSLSEDVCSLLDMLRSRGLKVSIISGDREVNVASFAELVGVSDFTADAKPADKLDKIQQLQAQGASVLMVGDGINDVPILSRADVSIAMGSASQLAQSSADSILLNNRLYLIAQAFVLSSNVTKKIKQNLMWALAYNLMALPLAVLGCVPPYIAAVGMSLSSIVVVINSLSLHKVSLQESKQ